MSNNLIATLAKDASYINIPLLDYTLDMLEDMEALWETGMVDKEQLDAYWEAVEEIIIQIFLDAHIIEVDKKQK